VTEAVRDTWSAEVQPHVYQEVDRTIVNRIDEYYDEPAPPSQAGVIKKQPIVQDQVKLNELTEIQPVIHRETIEPTIVKTTAPVYEKVVEKPTIVHEMRAPLVMSHKQVEERFHPNKIEVIEKKEVQIGKAPISEAPILGK